MIFLTVVVFQDLKTLSVYLAVISKEKLNKSTKLLIILKLPVITFRDLILQFLAQAKFYL